MASSTRVQLSLFVPEPIRSQIDAIRESLDPVQHRLIGAHVTLCREEDIDLIGLETLKRKLQDADMPTVTLRFGPAERFHEHGILLPCVEGQEVFQSLRQIVLGPDHSSRRQTPHLTLAHPRNPKAPGNDLALAATLSVGLTICFDVISLIEQTNHQPWKILDQYRLKSDHLVKDLSHRS